MAKHAPAAMLDAALDWVRDQATRMDICAGQPTSYADVATRSLGGVPMATGDFSLAAGTVSGRRLIVAAQEGIDVTDDGVADHVALTDGTSTLLYVTTLAAAQAVTAGSTADVASWSVEIADPS